MKILLLGKTGLLGSSFLRKLGASDGFELSAPGSDELDICDFDAVRGTVESGGFGFVINCTGFTDVDGAEVKRDEAFLLNGDAVENLASSCADAEAKLIHFSTDYVFDGESGEGYGEDADPGPLSIYGQSKLVGEVGVLANGGSVVRTSWLFGPGGGNFVNTMLRLADERDEISVVGDQFGCPTYSEDLAEAVVGSLGIFEAGIYHLTNSGSCSWYEFACEILKNKSVEVLRVGSEDFERPAKRPKNSVLVNSKLPLMRDWREALEDYLSSR